MEVIATGNVVFGVRPRFSVLAYSIYILETYFTLSKQSLPFLLYSKYILIFRQSLHPYP